MKAAIYCRLSKEDEDVVERGKESESIQNQKSMLIGYAIERGFDIYHIYCDEDYSGIDRDRPDFNRMIEAASQHKFDIILAKTQSRFTRDMELVEKYLHGKFVEWGIRFIAVVDHVDTADIANKKSRQINGLVNEWYLEDLSNNVRSVLTHKRKEGRYIATFALYGYQKDPRDPGRLVIDPEAAEVVRQIFALYLAGNGVARIANLLNQQGIPSPTRYKQDHGFHFKRPDRCKDGDLWGKATIHQMLRNQTYTGDLVQGRHKKISYKSKKTAWVPKDQWIIVHNTHEPIIDPETFARVQRLMSSRVRSGTSGPINPLAGKVFCGICGTAMEQTGSGCSLNKDGTVKKYFRCRMHLRDSARCCGQDYMPMEELQQIVLERIRHHAAAWLNPDALDRSALKAQAEQRNRAQQKELARLQNEIRRRRKAMQELYLDKSSGLISTEQFAQMNKAFLTTVEEMETRCEKLAEALEESPEADSRQQAYLERLQDAAALKALDRELVNILINRITIYPPDTKSRTRQIEVSWNF